MLKSVDFSKILYEMPLLLLPKKQALFSIFMINARWSRASLLLPFLKNTFLLCFICAYAWVSGHATCVQLPQRQEGAIESTGVGVTASWESPYVIVEMWAQIIWKSSKNSKLLNLASNLLLINCEYQLLWLLLSLSTDAEFWISKLTLRYSFSS